jgi:methylated-DNA-[protein]-cysteine S-methyltransferase
VGCRCPRAVGQALRRNPFAPRVPCHRVLAADLSLGGFSGQRQGPEVARKRQLLLSEGVGFLADGRVADRARFTIL